MYCSGPGKGRRLCSIPFTREGSEVADGLDVKSEEKGVIED